MFTDVAEILRLAAELEDPNLPVEVVEELGTKFPPFNKECWDTLREYQLIQPGYSNTEAQMLAFCLAADIVENPSKGK